MAKVLISYSRDSLSVAESLDRDIGRLGHTCWFDQDLGGGHAWWDEILRRIREYDLFVFVLTPASLESTACVREWLV